MMVINASAPWHKQSFDRFLTERLPQLLADRLPLSGYRTESVGPHACNVTVAASAGSGDVEVAYADLPQPDEEGVFELDGRHVVVAPVASSEELDLAEIRCAGEQLHDHIDRQLGQAPSDLRWDESLVRSVLPLDRWFREFLAAGQLLDEKNFLSRMTHLRRIVIPNRRKVIAPGQLGRVCPFETPEGTNIGRVLSVAVGAAIEKGRLVILDDRPEAALGLTASMVPFLEHNDPNRLLMAVNMMRQAYAPSDPEPAYVQTGNEPDVPDFWYGRNLLTAFVSWGPGTHIDGIVISESAAQRLDYPHPIEVGDKLSNRHGSKGTVTQILPDDQMPHLQEGSPVELAYNFLGLQSRMHFGQVREAVWGRIARAEGQVVIAPPFHAPREQELRRRLAEAGLPTSGMERLTLGRGGRELQRPSTVGWVYWGRLHHVALEKIHASVTPSGCQLRGENEYYLMRDIGAFETAAETLNTRSADRHDAATLARRVAAGEAGQAGPPSPKFSNLVRVLGMAGIQAELDGEKIRFKLAPPPEPALQLACAVPHPWLGEHPISTIGVAEDLPEYQPVVEANRRMACLLSGQAPRSLHDRAMDQLGRRLGELFDAMLRGEPRGPGPVQFGCRVLFSGRTVISIGPELRVDQVGLPDEIAWTLFGPLVVRELGDEKEVQDRTGRAAKVLDEIMARSWVNLHRAPTISLASILAFRPVRIPERVIRLYPKVCRLLNADFDGDQASVVLPITQAGQRESAELFSVAGHLRRDPTLIREMFPENDALWGLANLSLTPQGREQIVELAGIEVAAPNGHVTRESLTRALEAVLKRDGVETALQAVDRLMRRGFEDAKISGASMSPFMGESLDRPPEPADDDPEAWNRHAEELAERIASRNDFESDDLGPQLLAVKSGARGGIVHLARQLGSRGAFRPFGPGGVVEDSRTRRVKASGDAGRVESDEAAAGFLGRPVIFRNGFCSGMTPEETYACVVPARLGLGQLALEIAQSGYEYRRARISRAFTVLARAMRAEHPGIVFVRAAATGEADPLTDLDSRLFVGLPVE